MVKFISVAGIAFFLIISITMLWPRFMTMPRPVPLARLYEIIVQTSPGQQAANVLGVSDDASVIVISPKEVVTQITSSVKTRISNVIITHAVREITKRFKDLPVKTQEKVLEELSKGISQAQQGDLPPEDLPQSSEDSAEADN
jgi:hypothetical protein